MSELKQSLEEDEQIRSLRIYLRDHTAGAEGAVQLLNALKDHHANTPLGFFAAEQLAGVEEDLGVLEELTRRVGGEGFQAKEFIGWLGEKLSRLKLTPLEHPFNAFEAVEFLSLGILGKRALWRTLASVAALHSELGLLMAREAFGR
jgi:hypothetical protein